MCDFLRIPDLCKQNINIDKNKVGLGNADAVKDITVIGMIKPSLADVQYSEKDIGHSEEIAIIHIELQDITVDYYSLLRSIFKTIKYKCLLVLHFQDKYKLATCRFTPGKKDSDLNVLKSVIISCWIHPDIMSAPVEKSVHRIREALNNMKNLDDVYRTIHDAVVDINQRGTSYAHAQRIVKNLLGNKKNLPYATIYQYCTPVNYHKPTGGSKTYDKANRMSNHILLHDFEDIWYCLNRYEPTRRIIEGRQYKDMDELLYYTEGDSWY